MKPIAIYAALLIAAGTLAQQDMPAQDSANKLFEAGEFPDAEKAYAEIAAKDPKNFRAAAKLGELALFANRLGVAEMKLQTASEINQKDPSIKLLMAELYYREDKFDRAAALLREVGREAQAKQLESFKGLTPYEVENKPVSTEVPFIVTDPLPLVRLKVNGKEDGTFLIDTGASEVMLDPEFAKKVGALEFGAATGSFAGGKTAKYQYGRIDSLTLGDFEVKNVPIHVLNTRQFSPIFGGKQVDGIIGTVLFYHFHSTLDYPRGKLVIRRTDPKRVPAEGKSSVIIPFSLAGSHFMIAWGKVEQVPTLFFVDTGLAGGGVTLAESVVKEAGIKLAEGQAGKGIGGGGAVNVVPFMVKELSLGDAKEKNVRGLFLGAFPLERSLGFRIGGIISHGFFRPYAVTFDFKSMKLQLKRVP